MESYTDFAEVYDQLMDDVPYAAWAERIIELLQAHGIDDGLVLDLGCGTGTLTEMLAQAGYDMIGVDLSPEMLEAANRKKEQSGQDILYLCQDMRAFELYGTVRAIVCVCDSINYILKEEELKEVFRLANNYLDPRGIFLFDFNTLHKYRDVIGDAVIAEDRGECSFIWENTWHEEEQVNEYDLTVYVQEEDGRYRRFDETHLQRGYETKQIRALAEQAGMVYLESRDADTDGTETEETERVLVLLQEQGKAGSV
ncbi:MAG: class I SAM-dependent methyltransferase [Lachnospiraceae bacterium]|nr:class I SAM-dependent methyltransferase [Lachnospiraceae bacterium]